MTSLTLSFNDVNFSPVQQNGQVWLTASELANALGYAKSDAVSQVYERNKDEFTSSMTTTLNLSVNDSVETLNLSVSKKTKNLTKTIRIFSLRGCHLIAMFSKTAIAKQFRKWVLDILDKEVLNQQIEGRQRISDEQQALLHEIVNRRSNGTRKIYAEMWSRHNRHFKIPRYAELLAIHFPEAVHYLEVMDIKSKPEPQEVKALPYPQEVVQVAQQIDQEYKGGRYNSWFVHVRDDGQLSAMPLLKGYYPIDLAEFSKKFDGLLDFIYGSELLKTGRYLASK